VDGRRACQAFSGINNMGERMKHIPIFIFLMIHISCHSKAPNIKMNKILLCLLLFISTSSSAASRTSYYTYRYEANQACKQDLLIYKTLSNESGIHGECTFYNNGYGGGRYSWYHATEYNGYFYFDQTLNSLAYYQKTFGIPQQCIGNPCDPSSGNKYQQETDYVGSNTGLSFIRYYNSGLSRDNNGMGYGWTHQWGGKLEITNTKITVRQSDGRGESFSLVNSLWQSDPDSHLTLTQDNNGYILQNEQGTSEYYDLAGHLISQTDRVGKQTLYSYDSNGFVETVTGPFGHVLSFAYNTSNLLETITTPDNQVYRYEYDRFSNLTKVNYPENSFRQYHYENTTFLHVLTGITDENGDRYATFGYAADGKAILTQHVETDNNAPQEKFTLSYDSDAQ
jgi:YD repeat-containing protein